MHFFPPEQVTVKGLLGDELDSTEAGRLSLLPGWDGGKLITIFSSDSRKDHHKTDWYGEHAGKWMYATALAAARTGDRSLKSLLLKTADYLVTNQEADGYIGSYSPDVRFTNDNVNHNRSWDVWNTSYMILGLLEVNQYFPNPAYAGAAKKAGELFLKTFGDGSRPVTDYGTRDGISATIILDPVVELYKLTHDPRYLDFARLIIKEADEKEGLMIIPAALHNRDMSNVGQGKAYQVIWNLKAIAGLYEITGEEKYLQAAENAWKNIRQNHLTILGGPWGGIGNFYECFDRGGFWSPYGFTETCSSMAWIELNRELFKMTGSARYVQEIEKTAYNALSGAAYPDGVNWCYHSFANGRRHLANFDDCCPSSGAMALEEVAAMIYTGIQDGISCNLYTESEAVIPVQKTRVRISQHTGYPFSGDVTIGVSPEKKAEFPLFLRIPDWADSVVITVNGQPVDMQEIKTGEFYRINRSWKKNDVVHVSFPFRLRLQNKAEFATIPQSKADIYRVKWFALQRGPLVYATNGLIEDRDREKVVDLPGPQPAGNFVPVNLEGAKGQAYELKLPDGKPLRFLPYFEAGGRKAGTWRLTWVQDFISR